MSRRKMGRRSKKVVASVGVASLGLSVAPNAAQAFPHRHTSPLCDDNSLGFVFNGNNWFSHQADWVDGANQWNDLRDEDGDQFYFHSPGNEWVTQRVDLGDTKRGNTSCDLGSLSFKLDESVAAGNETRHVAAHEAGHGHGMKHSNRYGTGGVPMMASCLGPSTFTDLQSDDYAYAVEEIGITITPNSSFEHGTSFWSKQNATLQAQDLSNEPEGDKSVKFDSTASPASVYATTRYIDPDRGGASNGYIRARVNYKDGDANVSGTLTLQLQARRLDFPSGSGCDHIPNLDLNAAPSYPDGSSYVDVGQSVTANVNDGWSFASLPSSWTGASSWEGVDVRVRVYKNTTGPIWLDHTRAYQV